MSSSTSLSLLLKSSLLLSTLITSTAFVTHVVLLTNVVKPRRKALLLPPSLKPLGVGLIDDVINQEPTPLLKDKSLRATLHLDQCNTSPFPFHRQQKRPLIVGHRGCLYEELENTRSSFQKTAEMGADAVELDVFLLKCGTLAVFHGSGTDETPGLLKGYCVDRHESILEYTYDELQDIVFNENFPDFGCPAHKIREGVIPTLNQVLQDAKDTSMIIKIELKGPDTAEPVLKLVEDYKMQHQCHFSSFDLRQIAIIRALRPQIDKNGNHVYKTGALFNNVDSDYLRRALEVGASEVHLRYDECTRTRVNEIHAAGLETMAWFRGPVGMKNDVRNRFCDVGNEDWSMYKAVLETGVRQMCVNRPDVLLDMMS